MPKELIVSATTLETKVAVLEDDQVTEIFVERKKSRGILGNIYKGRVTKVLPGMQSAFVDMGLERDAFLYVSDFVEDYEEYEKMFTDAEVAAAKLLKVEVPESPVPSDEPKRRGRSRGRRRGPGERSDRPERSRHEGSGREGGGREGGGRDRERGRSDDRDQTPSVQSPLTEPETVVFETRTEVEVPPAVIERRPAPQAPPAPQSVEHQPGSFTWLDEVRRAQAALEHGGAGSSAGASEDSEARVRPRRGTDEFTLPGDDGGDSGDRNQDSPGERQERQEENDSRFDRSRSDASSDGESSFSEASSDSHPGTETGGSDGPRLDEGERDEKGGQERRRGRRPRRPQQRTRGGKNHHERNFSIGDLLREGQEIIVQVAKEGIAKKGARITSHIALPGRFVVYMPTVDHVGVSRKIASDKERARLREIVARLRGESKRGFIVRTAGENCEEKDLRADMQYLTRLWDEVRLKGERASAPSLIHSELDLVPKLLRDNFSDDFRAIRVDDESEYERIIEFIHKIDPSMVNRVKLFTKTQSIFDEYGINAEIEKALKQKVWLKSGGYIVINQTEALVAIDVNTGKYVGRGDSLEETITRTNLDAVKEVVRQIRLRDLGGIIVIDFIDMDERRNRQKVMETLEGELSHDKSPTKILQFNEFGLVAITRKRVKQSLERALCQPCPYCNGTAMVKSTRTVCYSIHAEVKKLLPTLGDGDELLIRTNPEVGRALREKEHIVLDEIHEMTGKDVAIKTDPLLHFEQFDIVEM